MAEQLHNQYDSQGRKQGYWVETVESGYIEKGHYVDGLQEGLWKGYRSNDTLREEGYYRNGKPHGHWKYYYTDGVTLETEGPYHNNMQHGAWKEYHEDGTLDECTLYSMDNDISTSPVLILLHWFLLI